MDNYSVLMSVYFREKPEHLKACIESMLAQTLPTNDFVIVCDGPLTSELDAVLDHFDRTHPGLFQLVRLPENVGIGAAANIGLQHCKNEYIAKMDADDISVPRRCEIEMELFRQNPKLSVVGGYIAEFDEDPQTPFAIRQVPLQHKDILVFARRRQAFNNVSVMYKKSAVEAVGGYRPLKRCEDFDLYTRLLHTGHVTRNVDTVLVSARVDRGGASRRASMATLKGISASRWYAVKIGFASLGDYLFCVLGELFIMVTPRCVSRYVYQKFLRQECCE